MRSEDVMSACLQRGAQLRGDAALHRVDANALRKQLEGPAEL